MHKELVRQLKAPGRMFIPVGTGEQAIYIVDKDKDGHVTQKKVMDVRVSIRPWLLVVSGMATCRYGFPSNWYVHSCSMSR